MSPADLKDETGAGMSRIARGCFDRLREAASPIPAPVHTCSSVRGWTARHPSAPAFLDGDEASSKCGCLDG